MKIHASGEDYLEAVLILQKKQGMVRSIDLARHMGFSKPSISHAVGVLKNGGFLTVDEDGYLNLTNAGREVAEKIYERHQFFTEQLCKMTDFSVLLVIPPEVHRMVSPGRKRI